MGFGDGQKTGDRKTGDGTFPISAMKTAIVLGREKAAASNRLRQRQERAAVGSRHSAKATATADWGFGSAAYSICLPPAKPRAIGQLLIVTPIGRREIACVHWSLVRQRVDALQMLDLGDGLLRFHLLPSSDQRR